MLHRTASTDFATGPTDACRPTRQRFDPGQWRQVVRIDPIDSVRGLAVILAMLSHALLQFTDHFDTLKPLTRTATPAFVILFGIMLEIAYLQRLRAGESATVVKRRLGSRMVVCYLYFAAITVAALATGKLFPMESLKALVFLEKGFLGVLLKIYTVLFLLVLFLLPLLRRYGANVMVAAAVAGWVAKFACDAVMTHPPHLMNFMVGNGRGVGPAILPSLTFVAFGMLLGETLSGKRNATAVVVVLLGAAVFAAMQFLDAGSVSALRGDWLAARRYNHPLYFALGMLSTSLYLGLFWLLWRRPKPDPFSRFSADMGQQTLFIYGTGNIILALLPTYGGQDAAMALGLVVLFMVGLFGMAWIRRLRPGWTRRQNLGGSGI